MQVPGCGVVYAFCVGLSLCASMGVAQASERRQMDAHEHGVTILNVATDGDVVLLELEGPAMNFVGFEHPPRTDEQKQAIADTVAALQAGDSLFVLSPAAACKLARADSEHIGGAEDEDEHHDDHDDDHHDVHHEGHDDGESAHSEFVAQYRFSCDSPDNLDALTVGLFEQFPLTSEVEASFVGAGFQTFRELTPASRVLPLQP